MRLPSNQGYRLQRTSLRKKYVIGYPQGGRIALLIIQLLSLTSCGVITYGNLDYTEISLHLDPHFTIDFIDLLKIVIYTLSFSFVALSAYTMDLRDSMFPVCSYLLCLALTLRDILNNPRGDHLSYKV